MAEVGHEAEEVRDVVWTYTGWAVILLVCVGAGVFVGYELWGQAGALQAELTKQTEMVNTLKNERETIKSQLALATTPTDGIAVRQIDSPTAFRDVALFWSDQGSRNPSLAAFVEAVTSADPPQIAQRLEADEA